MYIKICRKIRLTEGNAKCRHLKKLTCTETLQQVFIFLRPREPHTPPPLTHCMRVYSILIHTRKGGGGELYQREGERGNSSQSWVEIANMTACISILQSINSDKHLPRSYY
jgi:hypothetical protein